MLGLGLSSSSGALVVSFEEQLRSAFGSRLSRDGAYIEKKGCIVNALKDVYAKQHVDRNIIRDFDMRLHRDNAYADSSGCAITRVTSLITALGFEEQAVQDFVSMVESFGGSLEDVSSAVTELDAWT